MFLPRIRMRHRRLRRGRCRRHCSSEFQRPQNVAPLGQQESVAARKDGDILLAVDFKGGRGRIRAGTGLEFPELVAVSDVARDQIAVGFAVKDQTAGGAQ